MALLGFEGWDTATVLARALEKWWSGSAGSLVTGRTGINAWRITTGSVIQTRAFTTSGGFLIGFAFRVTAAPSSTVQVFGVNESATRHFSLGVNSTLNLLAQRNTTTLGTSSTALSLNTWYYVEIKGTIHDTTGSYEVRVDESVFGGLTGTNQDTRNGGAGTWDSYVFGISGTNGAYEFDDIYFADTSGAVNNDFLGDSKVDTLLPQTDAVAAGSNADFTPSTGTDHGALVDETNPNSTDYNSSNTVGHIDSYNYPVMVLDGTIRGVQVSPYLLKTDAGARTVSAMTRISGVNYIHATALTPPTSFEYRPQVFETSPATAGAWIVSEVNGAEFGLKVIS